MANIRVPFADAQTEFEHMINRLAEIYQPVKEEILKYHWTKLEKQLKQSGMFPSAYILEIKKLYFK